MFIKLMSSEKINQRKSGITPEKIIEETKKKLTNRVDINHLLARVKKAKDKETKINIILLGLFFSTVFIVATILSF